MGATLWANKTLNPGKTFGPEDGKIQLDTLEIYSQLPIDDVSSQKLLLCTVQLFVLTRHVVVVAAI